MTCLALALAVAMPIAAQPVTQPPLALETLVKSAAYQNNIARLFSRLPADVFQRCSSLVAAGSSVTVIHPVSFAPDGYPISGQWKQSFPVSGCGNDTIINFYFQGEPDEKITSAIGVAGATHAGLLLQRDALKFVGLAVQAVTPSCADIHILTSSYNGPSGKSGAWLETWTAAACGHVFRVPVSFAPDTTGTVITAKAPARID